MTKVEEMIKTVKKDYVPDDKQAQAILDKMLKMPEMRERIINLHKVMNENPATWKISGEEVLPTEYVESIIYDTVNFYQQDDQKDSYDDLEDALTYWFDHLVASDEDDALDFEPEEFQKGLEQLWNNIIDLTLVTRNRTDHRYGELKMTIMMVGATT